MDNFPHVARANFVDFVLEKVLVSTAAAATIATEPANDDERRLARRESPETSMRRLPCPLQIFKSLRHDCGGSRGEVACYSRDWSGCSSRTSLSCNSVSTRDDRSVTNFVHGRSFAAGRRRLCGLRIAETVMIRRNSRGTTTT